MKLILSRISTREWICLIAAICFFLLMVGVFVQSGSARKRAEARSVLDNCQQIEIIKDQIRTTVEESLVRLPEIEYYKAHPDELKKALEATQKSVVRFKPNDCYRLPVVVDSSIKRPKSNARPHS